MYEISILLISLWSLAALYRHVVRVRREEFRLRVRIIRDDLFDFMAKEGLPYSEKAYRDARQTLNGMLRLSNSMTPARAFLFLCLRHSEKSSGPAFNFTDSPALKKKIAETYTKVGYEWVRFLFMTGQWGIFLKCLVAIAKTLRSAQKLKRAVVRKRLEFERGWIAAAYDFGSPRLTRTEVAILQG